MKIENFIVKKLKKLSKKRTDEEKKEINRKISKTWNQKTDEEKSEIVKKCYLTKKINNTFNISLVQEIAKEELCKVFGEDNVESEYMDDRYPFSCDLYVKSLDLFIEINAFWTHSDHFFDENNFDDLRDFEDLKERSKYDNHAKSLFDVWTRRDVIKRETAIKNNLNYLVFWNNDLSDFYDWLFEIEDEVQKL